MLPKWIPKWVVIWFFLVATLSLAPLPVKRFLHTIGPLHNAGHIFVFCISGVLLLLTAKSPLIRALSLPVLFVFCAGMEFLQTIFYRVPFEWHDLWVDSCSLILAPSLFFMVKVSAHLARSLFSAGKVESRRHPLE